MTVGFQSLSLGVVPRTAEPKIRNLNAGTLEPCNPGTLATLERSNLGTLEPWNLETLEACLNPETLKLGNPGTLEPWNPIES